MGELNEIIPWVNAIGVPGLLAVGILALYKGWVVMGREHARTCDEHEIARREDQRRFQEMKAERDEWKATALKNLNVAERAVDTATRVVKKAGGRGARTGDR